MWKPLARNHWPQLSDVRQLKPCRVALSPSLDGSNCGMCHSRPLWAKREEQIRGVVESTAGLYGDLQGIAGRSLLEIDGLELPLLDGPVTDAAE